MRQRNRPEVHPRGFLERLADRIRGRDQLLVRSGETVPLLLFSYPRGSRDTAREFEAAWTHTFWSLHEDTRAPYAPVLGSLPALVVVLIRPRNVCECLGHHHPPGTESRLTKRLSADLGGPVGEVDVAVETIRNWRPHPLASMAASGLGNQLETLHFHAAILAVLLHELEHVAFPEHTEHEIRERSDNFLWSAMEQLVAEETAAAYGMAAPSPRP